MVYYTELWTFIQGFMDFLSDNPEAAVKDADVVMTDRGHLDPNPIPISKDDIIKCLNDINDGNL